jgi:hypothetical protein
MEIYGKTQTNFGRGHSEHSERRKNKMEDERIPKKARQMTRQGRRP